MIIVEYYVNNLPIKVTMHKSNQTAKTAIHKWLNLFKDFDPSKPYVLCTQVIGKRVVAKRKYGPDDTTELIGDCKSYFGGKGFNSWQGYWYQESIKALGQ